MTGSVPANSRLRDEYEIIEISKTGTGTNILIAAVRFLTNQIRMGWNIWGREEEMILFFGPTAYLIPILVAKLAGKTVVLQPRGDVPLTLRLQWEQRVPTPVARVLAGSIWLLERIGLRVSDAIITYTPAMAEELNLGVYESKLQTAGARYIDTDRFQPTTPLEERECVVGFLGRIDEEKGIRTLATAVELLPEDITFRFVGDGDLLPWLREQLSEEVETGKVEITGWVDHDRIPAELNRIRLLVMPSSPTEGLPTTILESLACGTPVYATPVSGIPDVINDGKTGFLMEESDPDHLCEDIVNILSRNDLAEIGANGRRLVNENYTLEAATNRYREILLDIKDNSV
jgi:glycosyltransferase involved in cell wall biosynthesis